MNDKKIQQASTELTPEDFTNLIALINKTPISGNDAEVVSLLKYKLRFQLEFKDPPIPPTPSQKKK